jgi:hypothetical protein
MHNTFLTLVQSENAEAHTYNITTYLIVYYTPTSEDADLAIL